MIDFDKIKLSVEEEKEAILEGKKRKFFHERNAPYWQERDPDLKEKGRETVVTPLEINEIK